MSAQDIIAKLPLGNIIARFTRTRQLLETHVSRMAFLRGMAVVAVLYALIFLLTAVTGKGTLDKLDDHMISETVNIAPTRSHYAGQGHTGSHGSPAGIPQAEGNALFPAPMDGLYDTTETGLLPKVSDNHITPFKAYRRPFIPPGKPSIAIAVIDYGLSESLSQNILDLPPDVSFILSPYASAPEEWADAARENGHELWMSLPGETQNYPQEDPGARGLLSFISLKNNQDNLRWVMSKAPGYAGLAVNTDSALTLNAPMMRNVFHEIFSRGLGVLEINPKGTEFVETFAMQNEAPYARNEVFLNQSSLKALETMARKNGHAIGIIEPYPQTIDSLKTWIDTLAIKGFALAPVSAVMDMRGVSAPSSHTEPHSPPSEENLDAPAPDHSDHHNTHH